MPCDHFLFYFVKMHQCTIFTVVSERVVCKYTKIHFFYHKKRALLFLKSFFFELFVLLLMSPSSSTHDDDDGVVVVLEKDDQYLKDVLSYSAERLAKVCRRRRLPFLLVFAFVSR